MPLSIDLRDPDDRPSAFPEPPTVLHLAPLPPTEPLLLLWRHPTRPGRRGPRLTRPILAHLRGDPEGPLWVLRTRATCEDQPLALVRRLAVDLLGAPPGASARDVAYQLGALDAFLRSAGPAGDQPAALLRELCALALGSPLLPDDTARLQGLLARTLGLLARERPLLLHVDDAQRSDGESLDLLTRLVGDPVKPRALLLQPAIADLGQPLRRWLRQHPAVVPYGPR